MCIKIAMTDVGFELVFWDRNDVAINVRRDADPTTVDTMIRDILFDLGAPATVGPSYTCYCGQPIPRPPGLLPAAAPPTTRPHTAREAMRYGA